MTWIFNSIKWCILNLFSGLKNLKFTSRAKKNCFWIFIKFAKCIIFYFQNFIYITSLGLFWYIKKSNHQRHISFNLHKKKKFDSYWSKQFVSPLYSSHDTRYWSHNNCISSSFWLVWNKVSSHHCQFFLNPIASYLIYYLYNIYKKENINF